MEWSPTVKRNLNDYRHLIGEKSLNLAVCRGCGCRATLPEVNFVLPPAGADITDELAGHHQDAGHQRDHDCAIQDLTMWFAGSRRRDHRGCVQPTGTECWTSGRSQMKCWKKSLGGRRWAIGDLVFVDEGRLPAGADGVVLMFASPGPGARKRPCGIKIAVLSSMRFCLWGSKRGGR